MQLTLSFIAHILGINSKQEGIVTHVTVDSRECRKGSLFVALDGKNVKGEEFVARAFERGAVAAIVSKSFERTKEGELFSVDDPLKALQYIAKIALKRQNPLVIGVTGSIGKTTTKDFIAKLLSRRFVVHKTEGSQNGQIGLALTILNADDRANLFVLEMGISFPNEMEKLIEIAPSRIAVVTKVAPAHIGNFTSLEHIAEQKSLLLKQSGLKMGFCYALNARFKAFKNLENPCYFYNEEKTACDAPFIENHLLENFSAACLVAHHLGVTVEEIQSLSQELGPSLHRFEKKEMTSFPHVLFIDDAYNNNPQALKAAFYSLQHYKQKHKRILGVIGEMRELGDLSDLAHQELGIAAIFAIDILFCFGQETIPLFKMFERSGKMCFHFTDKAELCKKLCSLLCENDVVLFKGARSNRLEECLDFLSKKQNSIKSFCCL